MKKTYKYIIATGIILVILIGVILIPYIRINKLVDMGFVEEGQLQYTKDENGYITTIFIKPNPFKYTINIQKFDENWQEGDLALIYEKNIFGGKYQAFNVIPRECYFDETDFSQTTSVEDNEYCSDIYKLLDDQKEEVSDLIDLVEVYID